MIDPPLQNILDTFTGADGGVRFVRFREMYAVLVAQSDMGDDKARELVTLVRRLVCVRRRAAQRLQQRRIRRRDVLVQELGAMRIDEFVYEATLGGPGLDGYAYQADVYCIACGEQIIRDIAAAVAPTLSDTDDVLFSDSETVPQPIFFGESDCEQHCGSCDEYLYGEEWEDAP